MKVQIPVRPDLVIEETVEFKIGNDGLPYAVMTDNGLSWEYMEAFGGVGVAHFDGYENAVLLQEAIGM